MMFNSKKAFTSMKLASLLVLFWSAPLLADQGKDHGTTGSAKTMQEESDPGIKDTDAGEIIFRLVAEAVRRNDPAWKPGLRRSEQYQQLAESRSALPNPVFTTGVFNVPLDSFSLTENPTTQWRFGLKQAIPRGKTRQLRKQQSLAMARNQSADSQRLYLQRTKKTQNLWLDLYLLSQERRILKQNRALLEQLIAVAENKLAEGRAHQQDVIQARLEWLRLKDRLIRVKDQMAEKEALYHAIAGHGDPQWPTLPEQAGEVTVTREDIARHPAIRRFDALLESVEKAVALAREKKKPMWVVGGEYRKRFGHDNTGAERNDLLAVTASIDLPFARKSAIDAEVQAAVHALAAVEEQRRAQWRQLQADHGRARSLWRHARESSRLYRQQLLPEAQRNLQAAEDAYSAGTGDFTAVIIAQKNHLDTQLQAIEHQVRQWQGWVALQYLKSHWLALAHQDNSTPAKDTPASSLQLLNQPRRHANNPLAAASAQAMTLRKKQ